MNNLKWKVIATTKDGYNYIVPEVFNTKEEAMTFGHLEQQQMEWENIETFIVAQVL